MLKGTCQGWNAPPGLGAGVETGSGPTSTRDQPAPRTVGVEGRARDPKKLEGEQTGLTPEGTRSDSR